MEYSTQPHHHQQQQEFHQSQYQHQEQHQHQQLQQDAYDPSQSQYQSYYGYGNHQYDPQQPSQYPYYYANSYSQQFQSEPTSIHPPGVPIQPDPAPPEQTYFQNDQQIEYYPHGVLESQPQQWNSDPNYSGGLNSAAAAPSQMTQFAGNTDAAQGAMANPQIGQSPYPGRGRRGGRPFRARGRGTPFRGRGRGRGGGRNFPPHAAASAPAEGASIQGEANQASVHGQIPFPVPAQVPAAPLWPPPRMAWCELCRVDCNTLEILEQHKNGKKHKKNLQIHGELQNLNQVLSGQQNAQTSTAYSKPEVSHPDKVERSEERQPLQENLPSEVVTDDTRNETEQQKNTANKSEASTMESAEEHEKKPRDQFEAGGHGFKHKMRRGRGAKYMRTNDGRRRPIEPPKPKQVPVPLICELCNVKCDTKIVFDSHLTGKKHLSNVKRFHDHRALYGEAGLQALYPPNINPPSTSFVPQVQQQVVNDPQVLLAQLLTYVIAQAQAQAPATTPVLGPAATMTVAAAAGPNLQTQYQQNLQTQGLQAMAEAGSQNAASLSQDNSGEVPLESSAIGTQQVLPATASDKSVSIPKHEVSSSDQVP